MREILESYAPPTAESTARSRMVGRGIVDKRSDFKNVVNVLLDQDGITYDTCCGTMKGVNSLGNSRLKSRWS